MPKIKNKAFEKFAYVLVAIGALNWGLDKVVSFNIVDQVLSWVSLTSIGTIVYGAIGLAGAWMLYNIFK